MVLNAMMYSEREAFLSGARSNKGNGYISLSVLGHGY